TSATGAGRGVQGGLGGRGLASGAKATVDVFRFHYGFWRRGSTGLKPGDVIVAEVSNPENLYTFDFDAAPKDPATGFVVPASLEPLEIDEDGNPTDPPEWFVPVETRMSAVVNAQFLDVSRIPGDPGGGIGGASSRTKYQAVLEGGPFAKLFVRNPTTEKASARYQRLVRSAKLGETQGQPVVKEQRPDPRGPRGPGRDPVPDEGLGGGGGGG
ncbi:MAG: hypothetical protein IIC50_03700, partial [Planctomycetes bacterium]|nr:hypothetical protein [Planctomycetota bacterium]